MLKGEILSAFPVFTFGPRFQPAPAFEEIYLKPKLKVRDRFE